MTLLLPCGDLQADWVYLGTQGKPVTILCGIPIGEMPCGFRKVWREKMRHNVTCRAGCAADHTTGRAQGLKLQDPGRRLARCTLVLTEHTGLEVGGQVMP